MEFDSSIHVIFPAETAKEQLAFSDGAIVGSCFKEYGEAEYPVDEVRVKEFMRNAQA